MRRPGTASTNNIFGGVDDGNSDDTATRGMSMRDKIKRMRAADAAQCSARVEATGTVESTQEEEAANESVDGTETATTAPTEMVTDEVIDSNKDDNDNMVVEVDEPTVREEEEEVNNEPVEDVKEEVEEAEKEQRRPCGKYGYERHGE